MATATKTKKTKEIPKIKTTKEAHFLQIQLTQDEVLQAGNDLATALDNKTRLEGEKEAAMKAFKAREAALDAQITEKQQLVRNKYTYGNVDCENVLDYEALVTFTRRLDTGEEIMRRPMNDDEKQTSLPFDEEE